MTMSGPTRLSHGAFFYGTADEFCDTISPFLRDGLAADDACLVATTPLNAALLRESLDGEADAVKFLDRAEWYKHPAWTVAGWRTLLAEARANGKRTVRIVGEVRFGEPDRHPAWTRYESALNTVFAGSPAWIVCPYNLYALPARVVADARRTHPIVLSPWQVDNPAYVPPERLLGEIQEPVPPGVGDPVIATGIDLELAQLRAAVRARVEAGGWLGPGRVEDLLVVVTEVAANSLRHGQPPQSLRLWTVPHGVVGEVRDGGGGQVDPLAAYRPPGDTAESSRGLWIAHHLSDALAIDSDAGMTRVRFVLYNQGAAGPA